MKWNKLIILALVMTMVFVLGCTTETITNEEVPTDDTNEESANEELVLEAEEESDEINEEEVLDTSAVVEVDMIANQWDFEPSVINANVGDTIILHVTSEDVSHGISIPDFGVNEFLPPGEEVTIEFVADTAGIFRFACSVSCGSGHGSMDGEIIVS